MKGHIDDIFVDFTIIVIKFFTMCEYCIVCYSTVCLKKNGLLRLI